jgi:hypothetical protein
VTAVVPNGENPHDIFVSEPKEEGEGKPVNKAASNVVLYNSKLAWAGKYPIDGRINLKPQFIAEPLAKVVVPCNGAV